MAARGEAVNPNVRVASESDLPALMRLCAELREEDAAEGEPLDGDVLSGVIGSGGVLLADIDGAAAGFALVRNEPGRRPRLVCLYVRPQARGRGLARALVRELVAGLRQEGATSIAVEARASNRTLLDLCERWGFVGERVTLAARLDSLGSRLEKVVGRSYGAIYVQTDDETPIRRRLGRFVPRLPEAQLSEPRNGWIELTDERLDEDPRLLQRLARELSVATGAVSLTLGVEDGLVVRYALIERGGVVDEDLSVPLFHGPLPPGDAVALAANPTAAARLTGADPEEVRAVCRTASSPSELPPADELYRQIAEIFGVASD